MSAKERVLLLAGVVLLAIGTAAPARAVPPAAPWKIKDIGPRITPGFVDVDPRGFWTIRATNGDVGRRADSFFFVYQSMSGDGSILALLLGQEGGDLFNGKAGIMIRESDSSGARNIHLTMTTGPGLAITYRSATGERTIFEGAGARYGLRRFPVWLRLQREGDRLTPFTSGDGFGWTQLHSPITIPNLAKEILVGVTAASVYVAPVAAAFSNVTVVPSQVSPIAQINPGNGAILVTWPPVTGAIGYMVRRSAPNTPGFAADLLTAKPIKDTSFSETGLANGQQLRYLVSAVFDQGGVPVEGWITAVTATPVVTPGNLFGCDLNLEATQVRGGILFNAANSVYTISGAGSEIGDTEDHCFFASQFVKGDFQITAKILDRPGRVGAGGMAGVMVRESLEGPSRMAFLAATVGDGVPFIFREETGGGASLGGRPAIIDADFKPPVWVRLIRRGATISALISTDGTTFKPAGEPRTFNPPLPESLYTGYAITSQTPAATTTGTFTDLTIGPAPAP